MKDLLRDMEKLNKAIANIQGQKGNPMPNPMSHTHTTSKQPQPQQPKVPKTIPVSMSPFPTQGQGKAICSRCGHAFKAEKIVKECPECGMIVAEEIDGELDWTEDMKEPIPPFVYSSTSPEEIFYKSIRWYYDKWIAKLKGNPSARVR